MILHQVSYKGKWFVYDDEEDEMYGSEGTVDSDTITDADLLEHAEACCYYGIPMYTGNNKEFDDRCERAWALYIKNEEKGDTI